MRSTMRRAPCSRRLRVDPCQTTFAGVSTEPTTSLRERLREEFRASLGARSTPSPMTMRERVLAKQRARVGEQTTIFEWLERRPRPQTLQLARRTPTPDGRGGTDASRPCEGCAKRARCRAPCDLLAALIPVEDIEDRNAVRSTVLSNPDRQDGGRDEQFLTLPREWSDDANNSYGRDVGPDVWQVIVQRFGEPLADAIRSPAVLTAKQRSVMLQVLSGKERTEIRVSRRVSRQSVHKIYHCALSRLRRHLGALPSRDALLEAIAPE